MVRKISLFAAAAAVLLSLCGCGTQSKPLRMDISSPVYSLDPQFTTDSDAVNILGNVMEGLLVELPDGTIAGGTAESYTVSSDGLTYTFSLRGDAVWENGTPVTSGDFVFAFRRIFDAQNPSPYAEEFSMIANAQQVLSGERDFGSIGISAPDDGTVIFTLSYTSPLFLKKLTGSAALPCNQEFFESTKARYGLNNNFFISNGPYDISKWDNTKYIVLEKSENYWDAGAVSCPSVYLYIGREDPKSQFIQEKSDYYKAEYSELEELSSKGAAVHSCGSTVWGLTFCQSGEYLSDTRIRKALVASLDWDELCSRLPQRYTAADSIVPDTAELFSRPYRELAASHAPVGYDPSLARQWLREALDESQLESVRGLSLMIPESLELSGAGGYIQKAWQNELLIYVNLEIVSDTEFYSRLSSGDYSAAIAPLSSSKVQGLFTAFSSGSPDNICRYSSPEYDALVKIASAQNDTGAAAAAYSSCEAHIIDNAVAAPLFQQPGYYVTGKGVSNFGFYGDGSLYLKYTVRK